MKIYWCERCLDYCPRRKQTQTKNGVTVLADIITHKDGCKEKRVWAKFETATERILEMNLV